MSKKNQKSIDSEYKLDVVSVRLVQDAPLLSNHRIHSPKDAIEVIGTFPNHGTNSHLFIRRNRGDYLPDQTVTKTFITKSVQSFCGFGPQTLRITCLQEMATLNGPNFLREAYGISATHAGRYGSYEEYLVEEALKEINFS